MMLRVIPIMWRAVRPSKVADMPAVVNSFWLPKGYEGLTFFGQILAPTQELADHFNASFSALKNHEMIHLRQAQSCGDSWLRFYLLYIWYWLKIKMAFCLVEIVPVGAFERGVTSLGIILLESLENVTELDIPSPFLLRCVGSSQPDGEGFLVKRLQTRFSGFNAISVVITLKIGDVFQQQITTEDIIQCNGVIGIGVK